ncbi:MAG: MotA/TolQ/ExbB proton channel family protein [Candidatus Aminicenantes bacterium]|nr:MAG: MotA/TolQ/ExbB proton channel family protein [Candidatus Aminicenantes bacterium]
MKNIVFALLSVSIGQAGSGRDVISLIKNATPVGKFALFILLIFSIVSWAVIIFKLVEYAKAKTNSRKFIHYFRKTRNFSDINKFAGGFQNNPLAEIFRYGYKELSHQLGNEQSLSSSPNTINVESLNRSLVRASNSEITRLERLNGLLATTASVTPFIGLFGTVWGIMSSFQEIGLQMNANLATVAPGIAEALIATALGLFAAIPAVIFYNLLLNKLKVLISIMEDFVMEFLNVSEKLK